jgi:large subunit ribosomal protein L4
MKTQQLDFKGAEKALGIELIANGKASQALHEAVVASQANRRAGTHSTKSKAEVHYSGAKPWKQKGTGNARAGYKGSVVWTKGGVVFGPHPRDYSKKTAKNVKSLALKKAISERAKDGQLHLVDALELKAHKTKDLVKFIESSNLTDSLLIVTGNIDNNLVLASRNLKRVDVRPASDVNAEDILRRKSVLFVKDACEVISKRLGN